jgi:hypothetical protein
MSDNKRVTELPPIVTNVENLDESDIMFLPCEGYTVSEWHPERDGRGKPTAIVLRMPLAMIGPLKGMPPVEVCLRIKSADSVDELIATLMRHRNSVWGGGGEG